MEANFEKIISFAIEKENEAAELYRGLSSRVQKQNAKTMFDELSAEEVKHGEFLKSMTEKSIPNLKLEDVTDLKISDYLVDITFKPDMDYQDILIMAMKREESAVKLYSDMSAQVQEPEVKNLLNFMSQQESKHKLRLETEYDKNVLAED